MKPATIGVLLNNSQILERFKGFPKPTTTPVPDDLIDTFMHTLTHAELKVVLYIARRTFGFYRQKWGISLSQIASGLVSKDGNRLDHGAGIDRTTAARVVKNLEAKGLIRIKRVQGKRGFSTNTYSLRFRAGK